MQKVLFIGVNWPEPTTAAGTRMLQLIKLFKDTNYKITFCSTAAETKYSYDLEAINVTKTNIELNNTSFDDFLSQLIPDIVVFDRFLTEEQFGWRVVEQVPNAIRILDTEDLHSLRVVRTQLHKKNTAYTTNLWLENDTTKREIASIFRCDISLIISSFEMQLLKQNIPGIAPLLLYYPFLVAPISREVFNYYPSFETRKNFICIGNGKHAPNVDAFIWLKSEIWPLISNKLPEAKLHIYGSYLPQQILEMHKPAEGFYVEGFAENLEKTFINTRINLAPLRFGAGLKGKLLDAMRYGTPSVTTQIGVEGFSIESFNGYVAENAEEFANRAVALYSDEIAYKKFQKNGLQMLMEEFNGDILSKKLIETIKEYQKNIIVNRQANFIGSLLLHQSMQSTKYMSKWIEAKNS